METGSNDERSTFFSRPNSKQPSLRGDSPDLPLENELQQGRKEEVDDMGRGETTLTTRAPTMMQAPIGKPPIVTGNLPDRDRLEGPTPLLPSSNTTTPASTATWATPGVGGTTDSAPSEGMGDRNNNSRFEFPSQPPEGLQDAIEMEERSRIERELSRLDSSDVGCAPPPSRTKTHVWSKTDSESETNTSGGSDREDRSETASGGKLKTAPLKKVHQASKRRITTTNSKKPISKRPHELELPDDEGRRVQAAESCSSYGSSSGLEGVSADSGSAAVALESATSSDLWSGTFDRHDNPAVGLLPSPQLQPQLFHHETERDSSTGHPHGEKTKKKSSGVSISGRKRRPTNVDPLNTTTHSLQSPLPVAKDEEPLLTQSLRGATGAPGDANEKQNHTTRDGSSSGGPSRFFAFVITVSFFMSGATQTLLIKWINGIEFSEEALVPSVEDQQQLCPQTQIVQFSHPYIMMWFILLGESCSFPIYHFRLWLRQRRGEDLIENVDFGGASLMWYHYFLAGINTIVGQAAFMNALVLADASIFAMLKKVSIIFTVGIAIIWLKKRFHSFQWCGLVIVAIGFILLFSKPFIGEALEGGSSSVGGESESPLPPPPEPTTAVLLEGRSHGGSNTSETLCAGITAVFEVTTAEKTSLEKTIGALLVILGAFCTSLFANGLEVVVRDHGIHPADFIGRASSVGLVMATPLIGLMQIWAGTPGDPFEDLEIWFIQSQSDWRIPFATTCVTLVSLIFAVTSTMVTKLKSISLWSTPSEP